MKSVVMRLNGGLGNQMFQYAFGKALARRHGASLEIDRSLYGLAYVSERYRLDEFDIEVRRTPEWRGQTFRALLSPKAPKFLKDSVARLMGVRFFNDPHCRQTPDIPTDRDCIVLVGYFQYPGFFVDIAPILRKDFQFRIEGRRAEAYMARIKNAPSIAVHVRRGDYANVPKFFEELGVLSTEYYRATMARMREQVAGARFFVFSNDPAWVRSAILPEAPDAEIVDLGDEARDVDEMALMRVCDHFIVGNSTFSWWPAFLGEADGKVVLAPDPWFRGAASGEALLLPEWTRHPAAWEH